MEIKVYGSGCPKCKKVYTAFEEAIKETGADATLVKVQDMNEIINKGFAATPAVEIDGKVVSTGRVINTQEATNLLK
ncbi:MAG TPA: thioredoxin family protein [Thermotogota bacterium]|nr:thioredoxin family protein [Thermotogota bacterium]HRW35082.1 thioredoxin family protein [Thermotogota bacterium]